MSKIFQNKFLSVAGQKERIANVGNTLKAAVTLRGVQSNTGNKTVDTVLSAAASNPYLTAAPIAASKLIAGKAAVAGSSKTLFSSGALKTAGLVGAGAIGASLLRSGTRQVQQPTQTTSPVQELNQDQFNQTNPNQSGEQGDSWADIMGDNNRVYQNRYLRQEQPVIFQPLQNAQPTQTTSPKQETGQSSSDNGLMTALLVGVGVYLLSNN